MKVWLRKKLKKNLGIRLGLCRSGLYHVDTKEAMKSHDIPVVLPTARNKSQQYDSTQHEVYRYIYHVFHVVPPIVVQNDAEAVNEAGMHEEIEAKDKEIGANEGSGKNNNISLQ
jgi:hypothetical protein